MSSRTKLVVGSIAIVGIMLTALAFPTSSGFNYSYTVQSGDTLSSIASKFGVSSATIASANGLNRPYAISTGEVLTIPLQSSSVLYAVKSGDTLYGISLKFEVSWQSIAQANNISYPYIIYPDQILVIPLSGTLSTTSTSVDPITTTTSSLQPASAISSASTSTTTDPITTSTTTTVQSTIDPSVTTTYTVTDTIFVTSIVFTTSTVTYTVDSTSTATVTSTSNVTSTADAATSSSTTSTTSSAVASSDPLATGNSLYDKYDSIVLAAAAQYNLDPMVLKSQIALESYFNPTAVSPDDPCGQIIQNGVDVGHSYGLMQMTPRCISWFAKNPDGTVDLSTNTSSPQWSNSAFNPSYNIYSAALLWSNNLQYAQQHFPGCTSNQYVYIGLSAYNAGMGSVSSCTTYNTAGTNYINGVLSWYSKFSTLSGWPDPYP